jgi:tRNA-dihydrouridine synthase B
VISIPLVANGDVDTPEDAQEILRRSGADAVMLGRGCQGRPWHAGFIAGHGMPGGDEIAAIVLDHYAAMLDFYGEHVGVRHARKHLGWYLARYAPAMSGEDKSRVMTSRSPDEVASLLTDALRSDIDLAPRAQEAA